MRREDKIILEQIKETIPNEKQWSLYTAIVVLLFIALWLCSLIDIIPTDYNVMFFILSVITGFYWFKERISWKKYLLKNTENELIRPWWLSWTAALFPIVVSLFLIRGFIVEPFRVPSGSMIPNIMIGEVTLTNKFYYQLKIPVIEKVLANFREVKRGDVVVFRYPPQPYIYYVKRMVGLPGDEIEYDFHNKVLYINSIKIEQKELANFSVKEKVITEYQEDLMGFKHNIWIDVNNFANLEQYRMDFPLKENCNYYETRLKCIVPKDNYFALGDNRDNSLDSRFWGFVPKQNIVGKAQFIAFSPVDIKRIGWIK